MNWQEFLDNSRIEYVTRGPNTKTGEVSVKCPFCGDDDPSQHLGISLTSNNWGCLRNAQHRGRDPVRLISALLHCSIMAATGIYEQYSVTDPDNLDSAIAALTGEVKMVKHKAVEERPALHDINWRDRFWMYLLNRGFEPKVVIDKYQLRSCTTGAFKDRIIIPYFHAGKMVAWAGRAITNPVSAPRYLSSSLVKSTIFNYDELRANKGRVLFVTEGPFDAINVDFHGQNFGARATCVSGTQITISQLALIRALKQNYSNIVVLFDQDANEQAASAADWLGSATGSMPDAFKDPGELYPSQIAYLADFYAEH